MTLNHQIRTALPNPILKSPVAGIDISKWEPGQYIDWSLMPPEVRFVIPKASELNWPDTEFLKHAKTLSTLNYKRSAYHFLHENDVFKQVDCFLKTTFEGGAHSNYQWEWEIPPVLDVEVKAKSPGRKFANQIKVWLDEVEGNVNKKPIIYTSVNFWNTYVCEYIGGKLIAPEWTNDYPLWVAQYPYYPYINSATSPGKLPVGWTDYVGWQYYDAHKFEAIKYNGCDVNVMKEGYFNSLPNKGEIIIPPVRSGFTQSIKLSNGTTQNLKEK